MRKLPHPNSAGHALLRQLAAAPGTFYQICERAEFDIEEDRAEQVLRQIVGDLVEAGHACLVGVTYHITTAARAAICPPAPYIGQVAGPAFRGELHPTTVFVTRRVPEVRP